MKSVPTQEHEGLVGCRCSLAPDPDAVLLPLTPSQEAAVDAAFARARAILLMGEFVRALNRPGFPDSCPNMTVATFHVKHPHIAAK